MSIQRTKGIKNDQGTIRLANDRKHADAQKRGMKRKKDKKKKKKKNTLRIKARKNAKNKGQKSEEKRRKSNETPPSAKGWRPHRTSRVSSCCLGITAQKNKKMTKPDSCELLQRKTNRRMTGRKSRTENSKDEKLGNHQQEELCGS